jgi:hypothetical protein
MSNRKILVTAAFSDGTFLLEEYPALASAHKTTLTSGAQTGVTLKLLIPTKQVDAFMNGLSSGHVELLIERVPTTLEQAGGVTVGKSLGSMIQEQAVVLAGSGEEVTP